MNIHSWQEFEPFEDEICRMDCGNFGESAWGPATWKAMFNNRKLLVILHPVADKVLAGFVVAAYAGNEGELLKICVESKHRQKGAGSLLLTRLNRGLVAKEVGKLFLEVRDDNESATRLYQKFGFEEIGRRSRYYSHPVCDAVLYSLNLR